MCRWQEETTLRFVVQDGVQTYVIDTTPSNVDAVYIDPSHRCLSLIVRMLNFNPVYEDCEHHLVDIHTFFGQTVPAAVQKYNIDNVRCSSRTFPACTSLLLIGLQPVHGLRRLTFDIYETLSVAHQAVMHELGPAINLGHFRDLCLIRINRVRFNVKTVGGIRVVEEDVTQIVVQWQRSITIMFTTRNDVRTSNIAVNADKLHRLATYPTLRSERCLQLSVTIYNYDTECDAFRAFITEKVPQLADTYNIESFSIDLGLPDLLSPLLVRLQSLPGLQHMEIIPSVYHFNIHPFMTETMKLAIEHGHFPHMYAFRVQNVWFCIEKRTTTGERTIKPTHWPGYLSTAAIPWAPQREAHRRLLNMSEEPAPADAFMLALDRLQRMSHGPDEALPLVDPAAAEHVLRMFNLSRSDLLPREFREV